MRVPRYKAVVDTLAADIRSGRRPAGARLPTQRALAAREGIALVTASRVYTELGAMGLVSSEQGRGTFVRETALPPGHGIDQAAVPVDTRDLSFNYPSVDGQTELLRQALRDLATAGDLEALLRYQPHAGRPHDRAAVAYHLAHRGLHLGPDQTLIVNGAQHGLAVTAMATLSSGDVVAVDALTYPGFKVLAAALGLDLVALPVTDTGPDLDALNQVCARRPVRAIYTMPTLHNPLGWVTDLAARERLVAIARHHGLLIIEDASYAFLAENPPPPIAALAPETTIYVSGLSKNVATGLRVGFLAAPPPRVPAIERAIRATTWNTPALTTAIACRWIEDGTVERLEAEKRHDARTRQTLARDALTGLRTISHPSSYFIWLPLPEDTRADLIAASLARAQVAVSTADPFATSTHVPQALRLALGSINLTDLTATLADVRQAVDDEIYR
ncbi:MAG: PLP-dependent aminotransferase family protein [Pseudonocardia sp.]|nr:PLP-dependent aminotransferase family protein [Pseudonocardia sp.]